MEVSLNGDPGRLDAVYRRRAEQLAVRRDQAAATAATEPVLVFGMGAERYGLPLRDLEAVLPFANCTPVPGARAELLGVTNVRGEVRVRPRPGGGSWHFEHAAAGSNYILLVRHRDKVVGLRVDTLEKAVRVAPGDLIATPDAGAEAHGRFVRGLTPDRVIVLDAGAVLDHLAPTPGH